MRNHPLFSYFKSWCIFVIILTVLPTFVGCNNDSHVDNNTTSDDQTDSNPTEQTDLKDCKSGPLTDIVMLTEQYHNMVNKRRSKLHHDELAELAYNTIEEAFKNGETITIKSYILQTADNPNALAVRRGYDQPFYDSDIEEYVSIKDDWVCIYNPNSHFEQCKNEQLFHSTEGVPESDLKERDFYIKIASEAMENMLLISDDERFEFYPYKYKIAMNASASTDSDIIEEKAYQVGVAFASSLDGWPIIGPGGKVYIHMLPDGTVVAGSSYRKLPSISAETISESIMISPMQALQDAEFELDTDDYVIERKEFGYLYYGKNSIQNVLSPSYVYFFKPSDPNSSEKRIIIVKSAISPNFEYSIHGYDRAREIERKNANADTSVDTDKQ